MTWRWLLALFRKGDAATPPYTTPEAIQKSKAREILWRYAFSIAVFLFLLWLLPQPAPFSSSRWLTIGILWLAGLSTQGLYLAKFHQQERWEAIGKQDSRLLAVAKLAFCYVLAFLSLSLLTPQGRGDSMFVRSRGVGGVGTFSVVLSLWLCGMWWIMAEEHQIALHFMQANAETGHVSKLAALCAHYHAILAWFSHSCRTWCLGVFSLVVVWLIWLTQTNGSFSSIGSALRVGVEMMMMSVLWMSGFVCFQETRNSGVEYGRDAGPASLRSALSSVQSDDPLIKMFGLCHVKWMVQFAGVVSPKYSSLLFQPDGGSEVTNWSVCTKVCCDEIRAMSAAIIGIMGSVPDFSSPATLSSPGKVRVTSQIIQQKYPLLRLSLGVLTGLLAAAPLEDQSGVAKYGNPAIGAVIAHIYEGHALISHFVKLTKNMTQPWLPYKKIWCMKPLQMDFEMTGTIIWKIYGGSLFTLLHTPVFLPEGVMKKHIRLFSQRG